MTRNIPHVDKLVGMNLRRARVARGLSQGKVGAALGVTFQQVQKYENGSNAIATTRIPDLCRLLKIEPAALFVGTAGQPVAAEVLPALDAASVKLAYKISALRPKGRSAVAGFVEALAEAAAQ